MNKQNRDNRDVRQLIGELASSDLDTCLKAADELGKVGAAAVDPLIEALRQPETGFGAIQALARIGESAIAPLIRLLSDSALDAFAAEALNKIGISAVPALIEAVRNPDDGLRFWATTVLGWIGDRRAIEPLKSALSDPNEEVRRSANKALAEVGVEL